MSTLSSSTTTCGGGIPLSGTLAVSGNSSGLYNTVLTGNPNHSYPNTVGTLTTIGTYSDSYTPDYDFTTKVLDLEKLSKIELVKREMLFNLFLNFMNNENHSSKTIMYNTLESYNVITEKKTLDRKIKIDNVTKSEKTK